jgi:FkbM family methyltransferase
MFPEVLSQAIIKPLANMFDPQRKGMAIEIGVGSSNFYCLQYEEHGFKCIAIDPLPYLPFLKISSEKNIIFEECCIYDSEGEITFFVADSPDLSSINADWWGVNDRAEKKVNAILLSTLLKRHRVETITFLKIDTEGSEYEIIKQLTDLASQQLPYILEFEYGGGGTKQSGDGGWSTPFFNKIIAVIKLLQGLNYKEGLILDSNDHEPFFFDLEKIDDPTNLFKPNYEYGNMLVFKTPVLNKIEIENTLLKAQAAEVAKLIDALRADNARLYLQFIKSQYFTRFINKLKRTFKK